MSQYEEHFDSGILVRCGWDPPLQCYYVQLHDEAWHEDVNPIIWIGTGLGGDPTTFDELVRRFRDELERTLDGVYLDDHRLLGFIHQHEKQLVADKEADR